MAANLLEFVMSLAHDREAAEAYAENPRQVLEDADLGDVSPADIDALLPMASATTAGAGPDTSVWRGSDALHAFDAPTFDDTGFDDAGLGDTGFDAPGSFESAGTFDAAGFDGSGFDGSGTGTNGEPLFAEVPATTITVPPDEGTAEGTDMPGIPDALDAPASLDEPAPMNGHSVDPTADSGSSFFDDAPSPQAPHLDVPDTDLPTSDSWDDI